MPASRQRSRSPFIAWAVIAMIGMCVAGPSFLDTDHGRRLEAVHFRHFDVHQDNIELLGCQGRDRFLTITGDDDGVPVLFQKANGQLLVHQAILAKQNPQRRQCFASCPRDAPLLLRYPETRLPTTFQSRQRVRIA